MDVIFMERKKVKEPVLDEDGVQVKEKGELVFRENEEDEKVEFEVHPHELLSSVIDRYIEFRKMPRPPSNIRPMLVNAVNGTVLPRVVTVKESGVLVFKVVGVQIK